jgi:hypothetical protein
LTCYSQGDLPESPNRLWPHLVMVDQGSTTQGA